MAVGLRNDPVLAFNFLVQLVAEDGSLRSVAGFRECSGLESELLVEEYQEGGVNDRVRKFPSRFTFGTLTLRRGVTLDPTLRRWQLDLLKGRTQRRDGVIVLFDELGLPVVAWRFEGGLPVKLTAPALEATTSEVAIETLEIAVEHVEPFDLGSLV